MGTPLVSVVVPVRNEHDFIAALIDTIFSQSYLAETDIEVIVADGMSNDGTREILDKRAMIESRLKIITNPGMIVSTGLNAAIRLAKGKFIIRLDAHTEYAPDYILRCIEVINYSKADNVGGPWLARGTSYMQTAIALAFQSPFSSGGAASHRHEYEGEVDSVYLGCWRKKSLERIGLFDEGLVRNQDDELNLRMIRSGGKIWQSPTIKSWYHARLSLFALFKQYTQYGYWKVRVIQKHRIPASIRHLVPGGFIAILISMVVLAPFISWGRVGLVGLLAFYLFAVVGAALIICRRFEHWKYLPVMPPVLAAFHFGYGIGFLWGMVDFLLLKKKGREAFRVLTR